MREGEVGIHPRLVKERELALRGEREVRMGDIQLTGVEDPKGVGGRVMDVKVTQNQEREGKKRKQILRGEGAVGGGSNMGAIRICNAKS